jgi:cytochrome c biogenesis protein CcdA
LRHPTRIDGLTEGHPFLTVVKLAVTVVAIALADCINPTLIGGELFVALGPHPRQRTAAFTLAALTVTFLFGLAFALGLGDLILSLVPKPGRTVKYVLITAAGLALILGGIVLWVRREALTTPKPPEGERQSHGSAGLIGAGIAGLELFTAFPYFAAIALIVGSGASDAGKLFLLVLYCFVYGLPLIVIAAVVAVMGDRADGILTPLGEWFLAHWAAIVGPLTAVIGLGVVAFGIVELSST